MISAFFFWFGFALDDEIGHACMQVMSNEEAFDEIRECDDAEEASQVLIKEALHRGSRDDISCIVVDFR